MNDFAYGRGLETDPASTVERLRVELAQRGFGVLAEISVDQVLKQKLGAEIPPLTILEVCSPPEALRALRTTREASLMVPCKVVVAREGTKTRVTLLRPSALVHALLPTPELEALSTRVEGELRQAIDAL